MTMNLRVWVAMVFGVFLWGVKASFARNYITWDDMKVEEQLKEIRLGLRDDDIINDHEFSGNRSRVIVVDQNGNGDSYTVQGAVDMVPLNNSQRVKIYILPGIYR